MRSSDIYKLVLDELVMALEPHGFRRGRHDIFGRALSGDAKVLIGFNKSSPPPHETVGLFPVVHVLFEPVRLVLAETDPAGWMQGGDAILTAQLYRLLEPPSLERGTWWFGEEQNERSRTLRSLIECIESRALPFLVRDWTVQGLLMEVEAGWASSLRYERPVLYAMLGERDRARELLREYLQETAEMHPAIARRYREFAQHLEGRIDSL